MKTPLVALTVLIALFPATGAGIGPATVSDVQCPTFEHIDWTKLPTHLLDDPDGTSFETIWNRWASAPPDIAWRTERPQATLHIETTRGALSDIGPGMRVVVGRRSSNGWEIYAREGEHPAAPAWTPWRDVQLSRSAQDRIDGVLADPCLWSAPRFLDQEVALRNGRYDARPDGPFNFYDVTSGSRRWGGMHLSWTVGAPARLRGVLLSAVYGEEEYPGDEIGPDGWLDQPS